MPHAADIRAAKKPDTRAQVLRFHSHEVQVQAKRLYGDRTVSPWSGAQPLESWKRSVSWCGRWLHRLTCMWKFTVLDILRSVPSLYVSYNHHKGIPRWHGGKEPACQYKGPGFNSWFRKILWRRKGQPAPVVLPGESHGQRSLVGYSPRGHKELDTA